MEDASFPSGGTTVVVNPASSKSDTGRGNGPLPLGGSGLMEEMSALLARRWVRNCVNTFGIETIMFILLKYNLTRCSSSLLELFLYSELDEFLKNLIYLLSRRRIAEKGSTIETEQKEDKNVSSWESLPQLKTGKRGVAHSGSDVRDGVEWLVLSMMYPIFLAFLWGGQGMGIHQENAALSCGANAVPSPHVLNLLGSPCPCVEKEGIRWIPWEPHVY